MSANPVLLMKNNPALKAIATALLGLFTAGLSASTVTVSEIYDFNDNSAPSGWVYTQSNGTNNGFVNGRWEAGATDGHGQLTKQLNLGGGTLTALRFEWDANSAISSGGNGSSTHVLAQTDDGQTYRAAGASGTYYGPTSPIFLATYLDTAGQGSQYTSSLLERTTDFSYLHYVATFSDGMIDLVAYLNGGSTVFGTSQLILPGQIALGDITTIQALTFYTTGNDTTWMDNLKVEYTYSTSSSSVPDTSSSYLLLIGGVASLVAMRGMITRHKVSK
jgi:hypothetical protein